MKIYDSLVGDKRDFTPIGEKVKMYVCGVTPYSEAHVGHAMSYIIFDVVRRYLEFLGYQVDHVQNFTDVDDKLIERAGIDGTTVKLTAEHHIQGYFDDMDALNIQRAHAYPKASEEVPSMISIIEGLITNGFAYESQGDVYFRVSNLPDYGKLSHRTLAGMRAGARIETNDQKEHPMDFALWKGTKPGEPWWESPWGHGRPGWHIECTAMAMGYLGETIDIHGGGQDLIFPHHENEIAQSEAFSGVQFARFWLHNGLLHMDQEKMSKSIGNLVTIGEALKTVSPDAIRFSVLNSHYRSPTAYSDHVLAAAERAVARLLQASTITSQGTSSSQIDHEAYRMRFVSCMDDDFNTPQAIAVLFDLAHEIHRGVDAGSDIQSAQQALIELSRNALGFQLIEKHQEIPPELENRAREMVEKRDRLRSEKRFAEADETRSALARMGITITDTSTGTLWKWDGAAGTDAS